MTSDGRVDAIRAAAAALNSGDVDGYLRHFDPSCKRWVAGLDQPLALTDIRDGIHYLNGAFEALFLNEDALFGNEQFVCARWRMRGIHVKDYMGIAPQRREIDVQTCEIYEFGGQRVITVWTYGDPGQLLRQIGAAS
jgi:predicted ester cyclase